MLVASAGGVAGAVVAGATVLGMVGIVGMLAGAITVATARRDPGVRDGSPSTPLSSPHVGRTIPSTKHPVLPQGSANHSQRPLLESLRLVA